MTEPTNTIWSQPALTPDTAGNREGRTAKDITEWRQLTRRLIAAVEIGRWTKAEVARRIGMADGTFNQWFSGSYAGRYDTTNTKVRQWLDSLDEMNALGAGIPESPPFVTTRTGREIIETLVYAQMMPEMVIINAGAGVGKTTACEHFCAMRPHAHLATMRPNTATPHGMLMEIAAVLGIGSRNPASIDRAIGERLQRNGRKTLLIVDEAQNLTDKAIDQLRFFLDKYGCGIALVGNDELYGRLASKQDGPSYAQIKRRIGKRLKRAVPYAEDIEAMLDAWSVTDAASRALLGGIGRKAGAIGQIDKTMKLAAMLANGDGLPVGEKHIRAAWSNRSVEDMA